MPVTQVLLVVTHLAVFMINHHIMWLYVPMHDSHAVAVIQGLQKTYQKWSPLAHSPKKDCVFLTFQSRHLNVFQGIKGS